MEFVTRRLVVSPEVRLEWESEHALAGPGLPLVTASVFVEVL